MPRPRRRPTLLTLLLLLAVARPSAAGEQDAAPGQDDQAWLREVELLMGPEEREGYLALDASHQREAFRARFWALRDPFPETPSNELLVRWSERWREATERWGDRPEDPRFRLHLLHGSPATVERASCGAGPTLEVWTYPRSDLLSQPFRLAFRTGPNGSAELVDPADLPARPEPGCPADLLDWRAVEPGLLAAMRPDPGWVAVFRAAGTDPPEGGVPVPGELSLRFAPGGNGDTTLVMVLDLPRDGFRVVPGDDDPRREIVVDGEILRGKDLHDHFRYRFEIPGAEAPERLVLPVERPLAPGPYRLRLRARDAGGPGYYRDQRDVLVPAATGHAATTEPAPGRTTIRIQPLPEELLTGTVRILAEASGERIDRVRFDLDGREVLSKGRPPYAVEIDLGQKPRRRTVRVTALDAAGREVARDEVALNVGPHRFTIRLIDPRPGSGSASPLRATAVVEVPRGERLERVELFLDDTRLATLYQPPYTLLLPAASTGGPLSHVRVVAHLVGGASAEDLVFLDAPEGLDAVDIQMVELYTTVLDRRGRPVPGLERRDFRVLEDGREQEVLRFLPSPEVPLHAGILLDTSTSMAERIDEAEAAALGFFYQILEDRDRAAVITFDESPRLRVPFTNRKDVLAGGLADLGVAGETALYDSLVYALYYFSGIRGRRALLLLSDGEDVRSRYRFEDALELARRTGVTIYTVGIDLPPDAHEARTVLTKLASETGGRSFSVDRTSGLELVHRVIETELRTQYLLAYQSDATDRDRYREVRVVLDDPRLKARTLAGYYP